MTQTIPSSGPRGRTAAVATRSALAVGILTLFTQAARADEAPTVEDVDQRLRVLERKLELQQEDGAAKAKEAATTTIGDKGFSWKSADGTYELAIKALVQADARFYLGDTAAQGFNDTFLFRRVEPSFQGSLGKLVGFVVTPQFAGSNSSTGATLLDAWIDLKFHPLATVRVGKFKEPVGLETLQSSGALTFAERGLPNELNPGRDIGLQLSGKVADGAFTYALGVFNGTVDGRDTQPSDVDNRKELAARLWTEPFRNSPGFFQGLGFGVGASYGQKLGDGDSILPKYRTPGQNTFFQYTAIKDASGATPAVAGTVSVGPQLRYAPQLYWYHDGFGLVGEYTVSRMELLSSTNHKAHGDGETISNTAWQVETSYVITGEDASYRGVKPKAPFTLGGEGFGAVEVAARYGVLSIDDDAFPTFASLQSSASKATAFGAGVNWYLTPNLKLVADYDQTSFDDGAKSGTATVDRRTERVVILRSQLAF